MLAVSANSKQQATDHMACTCKTRNTGWDALVALAKRDQLSAAVVSAAIVCGLMVQLLSVNVLSCAGVSASTHMDVWVAWN